MKLFEYMAQGKPILCSDFPVLREVLEHERSALFVKPDCPRSWVEAITRLKDDSELGGRLARESFNLLKIEYTWLRRADLILRSLPQQ